MTLAFTKMHGAGNDFVVIDARSNPVTLTSEKLAFLADRHKGIGCDQVIIMEPSQKADLFMRIYNADGSEVASCGNATRCIGWLAMQETGGQRCTIETAAGILTCENAGDHLVRADMGMPRFDWQSIPLSEAQDTLHLSITAGPFAHPAAASMGNPHMVFVVDNIDHARVAEFGPQLEHHPLFPQRANVSFAQPVSRDHVRLRVWERGAGETLACGTAACATLATLHRRGLIDSKATIELGGGELIIDWDQQSGHIFMTGPVAVSFRGTV